MINATSAKSICVSVISSLSKTRMGGEAHPLASHAPKRYILFVKCLSSRIPVVTMTSEVDFPLNLLRGTRRKYHFGKNLQMKIPES